MKTKIFIWICAILLLCSFAAAICSTNQSEYLFFEDWETGAVNTSKWTNISCVYQFSSNAYSGSYALNVTEQAVSNCLKTVNNVWSNNVTVQFAIKSTVNAQTLETVGLYKADDDWWYFLTLWTNDGASVLGKWNWFSGAAWNTYNVDAPDDGGYQIVKAITNQSSGKFTVDINGTVISAVNPRAINFATALPNKLTIGKLTHAVGNLVIDDIMVWNRTIYGDSCPPYVPSVSPNFTVSATDEWNSNSLNISVIIDGVSYGTNTTITTDILQNSTSLHNITIGSTGYFNRTYTNYNVSSNLAATLHQAEICFNASSKISTSQISIDNITIISVVRSNCFNISAGTYNVMAQKTGWNKQNQSFTITALSNTTYTIANMTSANVTIYARNVNGTYLSNYQINLTSLVYPEWPGDHYTSTTNQTFYLINGTYNVKIDATGYALTDAEANITVSGSGTYTFNLYPTNSLNISFYDEDTGTIIPAGVNVTYEIIHDDANATTGWTNTSIEWVEGLTAGDYEIRYRATTAGYTERSYYFTIENRTYNALILYLLNNTGTESITTTLYDEYGNKLEGYTIKLLRYYASESGYVVVDEGQTNSEGQTIVSAIRNGPYYKYRISEADGDVLKTTTSTQIFDTSISLYVTLGAGIGEGLEELNDVQYSLSWLNTTNQFKWTYDTRSGLIINTAVYVYRVAPAGYVLVNSTTSTSSSGTIYVGIAPQNETTYICKAYVTFTGDTTQTLMDTLSVTYDEGLNTFGSLGLVLTFIIVLTFALTGVFNPAAPCILIPVAMIVTRIARLHSLEWTWIIAITALGAIILYLIRDKT